MIRVEISSIAPSRSAMTTVTSSTIPVKLRASSRVGQVTLRNSARVSRKYLTRAFSFLTVSTLFTLIFLMLQLAFTIEDTAWMPIQVGVS